MTSPRWRESHPKKPSYRDSFNEMPTWFKVWAVFIMFIALVGLGVGVWVVFQIVPWITSK